VFVEHPRVAVGTVERRAYQEAIAAECLERNTLVILPTGMGKTVVALLVLSERLREGGRALVLAPTKPLVDQHTRFLRQHLSGLPVESLTGEVSPDDRAAIWARNGIICSTPQVAQNDLTRGALDLAGVRAIVFDEAHRAVGEYAYAMLARAYRQREAHGRVVGMTASPGANEERIGEVMENLGIEGIEIRSAADPDVAPFVQPVHVQPLEVVMPPAIERLGQLLRGALRESLADLQRAHVLRPGEPNRRDLLEAQRRLAARVEQGDAREHYQLLSAVARAMKLDHAVELCETQALAALRVYLQRLEQDPSRAAKAILNDARVDAVRRALATTRIEHPKLRRLALLLQEHARADPTGRAIVFAHYRDTAEVLQEELARLDGIKPVRFVGQGNKGDDKGLSQKEQQSILDAFRAGEQNVLIATSVAEEGLDIPSTDLVVFYEPVPSEIRSIQRRGRTGRDRPGRVIVLLTKNTRDVATYWVSRRKEQAMRTQVDALRARFARVNASWERPAGQRTLAEFAEVLVDHRVARSVLADALRARGVALRPETLPGATFTAGGTGVRVVDASEVATPSSRSKVDIEVRSLHRFRVPVVMLLGEPAGEAGTMVRTWESLGMKVERARDATEGAQLLAGLFGAIA
jgi:ERCC4-related helicase